jgi:hypothetical protein
MSEENKIKIVLDIFSGMKNPEWIPNDAEVDILLGNAIQLPKTNPAKPPILGYRGFVLHNIMKFSGLPKKVLIYNRVVTYLGEEKFEYFEDINGLEEWLLSQEVFKEFVTVIREELKRNTEMEEGEK